MSKVREAVREAGASLLGALAASTILTAAIAFPLAVRAVDADDGPAGIDEAISVDDARFPDPVHLAAEQAEILAGGDTDNNELDDAEVERIMTKGALEARTRAEGTMVEIRKTIGLNA